MVSVTQFLFKGACDDKGRTLNDYHVFTDEDMEKIHDYIQWMFPLNEPSGLNPLAPIVAREDTKDLSFNRKMIIMDNLDKFCGFLFKEERREAIFNCPVNHNHLRISRVIKSLRLFGANDLAGQFAYTVKFNNTGVLDGAIKHWDEALHIDLWKDKE